MTHGVVVEAELGTLAGVEDEVVVESGKESYTRPEEVEEFVYQHRHVTPWQSLSAPPMALTSSQPAQCTRNAEGILVPPPLRFDVLEECIKSLPGFPIVLHGSSSVPQEFVKIDQPVRRQYAGCNRYSGGAAAHRLLSWPSARSTSTLISVWL